mmetsp:Transcript_164/g.426  ORF Transcript_164/g.426 Transcript_164/m.426 type:complete len:123 (+) Transcript_164:543-911(+)
MAKSVSSNFTQALLQRILSIPNTPSARTSFRDTVVHISPSLRASVQTSAAAASLKTNSAPNMNVICAVSILSRCVARYCSNGRVGILGQRKRMEREDGRGEDGRGHGELGGTGDDVLPPQTR